MRRFITIHFSLYFLLITYISSFTLSILVEASPISNTHTELWQYTEKEQSNSPRLSKRITSIFPNSGHGSTTFNVIHVIAAVIGIIGAAILVIVLVLYYKRKRRRLIAEEEVNDTRNPYLSTPLPSSLSVASSSSLFNNGCRSSLNPQSSIPGGSFANNHQHQHSTMSQFQVFQSDYYYDDEKQQAEKLIQYRPSACSSSSTTTYPLPPPPQCHIIQNHPSSPPPYKP